MRATILCLTIPALLLASQDVLAQGPGPQPAPPPGVPVKPPASLPNGTSGNTWGGHPVEVKVEEKPKKPETVTITYTDGPRKGVSWTWTWQPDPKDPDGGHYARYSGNNVFKLRRTWKWVKTWVGNPPKEEWAWEWTLTGTFDGVGDSCSGLV